MTREKGPLRPISGGCGQSVDSERVRSAEPEAEHQVRSHRAAEHQIMFILVIEMIDFR